MTMQTLLDKEVLICISINSNVWNWCVEIVDLEMSKPSFIKIPTPSPLVCLGE